jgi:hypothetical protein
MNMTADQYSASRPASTGEVRTPARFPPTTPTAPQGPR